MTSRRFPFFWSPIVPLLCSRGVLDLERPRGKFRRDSRHDSPLIPGSCLDGSGRAPSALDRSDRLATFSRLPMFEDTPSLLVVSTAIFPRFKPPTADIVSPPSQPPPEQPPTPSFSWISQVLPNVSLLPKERRHAADVFSPFRVFPVASFAKRGQ